MTKYGHLSDVAVALPNVNISKLLLSTLMFNYCSASPCNALDTQAIGSAIDCHSLMLDTCSVGFIPWHNTQAFSKGIMGLNRMYDSLPNDNALKLFLDKHCLHLLKPLEGHTNIPVSYADASVLGTLPDAISPGEMFNPNQYINLQSQAGVYVFFLEGEKKPVQCGSTVGFYNRMRSYYYESDKGEFIFANRPISGYKWVPIVFNKDYVGMYNNCNVMIPAEEFILKSFMQQEVRSSEQAYSTYAMPSNYKFNQVSTWHNEWVEGVTGYTNTAKRTTWTTENGTVHTRNSIQAGVLELGFDGKYVRKVASLEGAILNTSKYGKVSVDIEGISKTKEFDKRYGTPKNTFVETSTFKPNFLYLLGEDMNLLPFGPYSSARKANQGMGLPDKYGGTHLWTNYMHLIYAPALDMSVYVVKRGEQAIPVLVKSTANGTTQEYPSMSVALKAIAPGASYDTNLLRNIVRGKPYSYKKGPAHIIRFKHQQDYDAAISRYLALGYKLSHD